MFRSVVAAVAVLAVACSVALWAYLRGDDSAEAQAQLIRWVNVTVEVPEDSGVRVTRDFWGMESTTPAMIISPFVKGEIELGVVVSAETGAILEDRVQPEHREAIDEVLKTLRVSPLDRSTAPWPYSGEPPNVAREDVGNISYITPDPAAGIRVIQVTGDGMADDRDGTPGSNHSIQVSNGRSAFGINAATGEVYETARILSEDKEAFDRFLSTVDRVAP